ncbi:GmrSD restriction endonuclease domain-containing protein [Rhodoblastus sp.]|uniref:GmrSD restriction endonuclease domain-containing protein n=1 Tax=Rhodoblastus sp. TaxID=1962975 RepID=UPI003F95390A
MTTSFKTNPIALKDLMRECHEGKLQLPDFQRGWVWDQHRIIDLLASISEGFPVGALMTLDASGEVAFAVRPVEGAPPAIKPLDAYLLDGQQRMTSLYQSTSTRSAVVTQTANKRPTRLHFYFDIGAALNPNVARRDAIVAVPEDRVIRENFGRDIVLDLSTEASEFAALHFPIDRIFEGQSWIQAALTWVLTDVEGRKNHMALINDFSIKVINNFTDYQVPVITLGKDTSRPAVCLVFEKVNTGGKALDAFELVTAMYAGQEVDGKPFRLRDDWKVRRDRLAKQPVLANVEPVEFLQAVSLLHTKVLRTKAEDEGRDPPAISATRNSLLQIPLSAYVQYAGRVEQGYLTAAKFLHWLKIFRARDLPYQTQLVPLAAILAELGPNWENDAVRRLLAQWYWCGVFGELYGSAVESRFALDIRDVPRWISGGPVPQTIGRADFREERLRTLRTRLSAAYKGVHALLMRCGAEDFRSGQPFDQAVFFDENVDIHHVFPEAWCKPKIKPEIYNSIINKTPLSARTNRIIGGVAPSAYLARLEKGGSQNPPIAADRLETILQTHEISVALLQANNFSAFFDDRRERLLKLIETAMGKTAVREDVAPPDPDDSFGEDEQEAELMEASESEVAV